MTIYAIVFLVSLLIFKKLNIMKKHSQENVCLYIERYLKLVLGFVKRIISMIN